MLIVAGPEILTKSEIEDNIKNFLLDQPEEEIGVTSCLVGIHEFTILIDISTVYLMH